MDVLQTIRCRGSVRAFADEPLDRSLLEAVLHDASRAPSAINMQPWEVHMALGEERKRLSKRLLRSYRERRITCGPGAAKEVIPERFLQRGRESVEQMTPLVERMGSDFRTYINEGSLDFYGAPAVALIFLDELLHPDHLVDVGSFMGYLVLAAAGHGLGSCPIGLVSAYQDEVKDQLNIPESKTLVVTVALGRPDPNACINEFRSTRAELSEFVRWID
ncbi:MAG: nitroreductase [Deltaproteobacteria bacterium]|nr:nitroreductase [Deltaproteobacteria bacterium]